MRRVAVVAGVVVIFACGGSSTRAPNGPPTSGGAAGPKHLVGGQLATCFIGAGATVRCWGNLSARPAKDPSLAQPRPIEGAGAATEIALADDLCVLAAGSVRCRGGDANAAFTSVALPARAARVVGGQDRTCAILEDRRVACWSARAAAQVIDGVEDIVDLALGIAHVCALRRDGRVLCWGNNEAGSLGDGTTTSRTTPAPVVDLTDVVRISSMRLHTCALRANGTVRCWGIDYDGQLGDGAERGAEGFSPRPVDVLGIRDASDIAVGNGHACALVHGKMWCWGTNGVGQLGDGTTASKSRPVEVRGVDDVVEMAAGGGHQCALHSGRVSCWGANPFGQCGQASLASAVLQPTRVPL